MPNEPVDSFRAKPSLGWLWLAAFAVVWPVPIVIAFIYDPPAPDERFVVLPTLIMVGALAAWFLVTAFFVPRIRYDLGIDAISISCGPLLRYRVPYAAIRDVGVRDLRFSPWSSFRFPGIALWKVTYTGSGQIRMCSTRSHRGVLVITAGKNRYGISPAEEDRFVHSLRAAVERASQSATVGTVPRLP